MDAVLASRRSHLTQILGDYGSLLVAYSGGVDSTYLLAAAVDVLGEQAVAVTAVSPSLAASERASAREQASLLGARHVEIRTDEMERAAYRRNDRLRCYHCKDALFDVLIPLAEDLDMAHIAVGVLADDLDTERPGQRAAAERGIRMPLAEAGLRKSDVRALSRSRGLPTADKPAAPCLASRVAYGIEVTDRRLARVEAAEAWLRQRLGARANVRVRDHGDAARIEVDAELVSIVAGFAAEVDAVLRDLGWQYVGLDLGGFRSGSLNTASRVLPVMTVG